MAARPARSGRGGGKCGGLRQAAQQGAVLDKR
jgi:hypothetical protein